MLPDHGASRTSRYRIAEIAALVLLVQGGVALPIWAYLDPGTGSYVFQVVTAALVGGLVALKVFWGRILRFFKGNPPAPPDDSS
jgi:hypothetical protein